VRKKIRPTRKRGLVHAVDVSANRKTGIVSVTYASQNSCPDDCPLRGGGCYAESGPTGIWTKQVNEYDPDATALDVAKAEAEAIREVISGTLDLRLHVVGDCSTDEAASIVSDAALRTARPGRRVWSYTHAWRRVQRGAWGEVSVLASCETPIQARQAQEQGWATAVIVPAYKSERLYEEQGLKILPCPNETRGTQCVDCGLCMKDTFLREKGYAIGFTPHGSGAKKVAATVHNQLLQMGSL
jgi:hypothetical protein